MQCASTAAKANQVLGKITRGVSYRIKETMLRPMSDHTWSIARLLGHHGYYGTRKYWSKFNTGQ